MFSAEAVLTTRINHLSVVLWLQIACGVVRRKWAPVFLLHIVGVENNIRATVK